MRQNRTARRERQRAESSLCRSGRREMFSVRDQQVNKVATPEACQISQKLSSCCCFDKHFRRELFHLKYILFSESVSFISMVQFNLFSKTPGVSQSVSPTLWSRLHVPQRMNPSDVRLALLFYVK